MKNERKRQLKMIVAKRLQIDFRCFDPCVYERYYAENGDKITTEDLSYIDEIYERLISYLIKG